MPRRVDKSEKGSLVSELSQSFFELLLKHRNHYIDAVSDEKIAPMQGHVLHYVAEHPCTMRELAQAAFLEPSNLTGIIDKLEARGLVKRREADGDRRSKIVTLTAAGVAMRKRLYARFSEPAPWMVALTSEDQQRLLEIVRKAIIFEKSLEAPSTKSAKSTRSARPSTPTPYGKRTRK